MTHLFARAFHISSKEPRSISLLNDLEITPKQGQGFWFSFETFYNWPLYEQRPHS
jgi:hypothetical protein